MRLSTSPDGRRAAVKRGWRHYLSLERLEDRVVPSIPDGSILVTTSPSSFASTNQSSFPTGIVAVDPNTGLQTVLTTGGFLSLPTYMAEDPSGLLYIADLSAFGTGAVIRYNPNTNQQSLLREGPFINGPNAIAFVNGAVYVANVGDSSGSVHSIVKIDPNTGAVNMVSSGDNGTSSSGNTGSTLSDTTKSWVANHWTGWTVLITGGTGAGQQRTVASNSPSQLTLTSPWTTIPDASSTYEIGFSVATGMVPAPGDNVYVGDEPGNFSGSLNPGQLWEVNLDTGVQTIVSDDNSTQGNLFNKPVDIAVGTTGLFIANTGTPANNVAGSVFRVNPQDGVQSQITPTFGSYSGTNSIEVGANGTIFVGAIADGPNPGTILAVNPATGAYTTLASGGNLSLVEGIRVYHSTIKQTMTTVVSSANPSVFGQGVTFTATVAPTTGSGTPTGTVQFVIDGTNFGNPVTLAGGVATSTSINLLSVTNHTIQANYSGDATFGVSNGTLTQTVGKASTATALSSSINPSAFGQSIKFTATVSVQSPGTTAAANPTGSVTFFDGGNSLGSGTLATANGVTTATFTISSLPVALHTITASYGGDGNFTTSSRTQTQTVGKASTGTTLSSSANPSFSGQSVTFTATVGVAPPGAGVPTGTVQFTIDNSNAGSGNLSTTGGVTTATFSTSSLTVGTHTVAATYSGDANFTLSTATLTQTISTKPASNTVVSASANPSVFGQGVSFTATVSASGGSGTPTGTVQFLIDGTSFGSPVTLSGGIAASGVISSLPVNNHTIQAVYSGDSTFAGGSGTLTQTVNKANTSTLLSSSAGSSVYGQNVGFTATIGVSAPGAGTPTGSVQFAVDGSNAGSPVNVSNAGGRITAFFSTASLTAGTHAITASYSGDGNFTNSIATTLTQTVGKASTSTVVNSSTNPSVSGQSVAFIATVGVAAPGAGSPTGTIQFVVDGSNAGSVPVNTTGGVSTASFSTGSLPVGTHTVTVSYSGDSNFASSNDPVAQTVNKANTSTFLTASVNPSVVNQSVMFTASISVIAPGSGMPTGTVQFMIDSQTFGSPVPLSGGVATSSAISSLPVNSHNVQAIYSGDSNFVGNTGTLTQTVNMATTNTVVSASVNPSLPGQAVGFTATVSVNPPGTGAPTGTVQFVIDGNPNPSPVNVSTSGGVTTATFSTSALASGTHTVIANYSGDSNFAASSGTLAGGESVTSKPATSTVVSSSINPSVFGQGVSFTATVSASGGSGTPTGTVQFLIDGTSFGSPVNLSGGVASSGVITSLPVNNHTIQAVYSGDSTFAGGSGLLTQTVGKANTSTLLTSSGSTSVYGQNVGFTATIGAAAPGGGIPTGSVQFAVDGTNAGGPVNVSTAGSVTTASFSIANLAVGSHTITASYVGDANFNLSNATPLTQTVTKANTSTVVSSSANPSLPGQPVAFTATVGVAAPGGGTPSGTVQFVIDGNTNSNPVNVSTTGGVTTATFSAASLASGTHVVAAMYNGDTNFAASTGMLTQTVTSKPASSTVVSSAINPSVFGQGVSFTATVSASGSSGTPTGTVQFLIDGTNFGSPVNLSGGVATSGVISSLPVNNRTIQAVYSGDSTFAGGSGTLTQTVNKANTSTLLTSSGSTSVYGQNVGFTATIGAAAPGGGIPTGSVQFAVDGTNAGGPVNVSTAGSVITASFSIANLAVGSHTITASYVGDANFNVSNATPLTQTVNPASTSTALVSSLNPSASGQAVTFTATISTNGMGNPPTGTVQWLVDNTKQGSPVLVSTTSGVTTATLSLGTLLGGPHAITASYSGDGNYLASSGTLQQTVNAAAGTNTTTTVTSSVNPQTTGQPVSWTATVAAASGTVNFVNFETGDFSQAASHVGGALVTSPALAGTYSLQLLRNGSVANYEIRQSGTTYYNLPTAYYRFLFEFTSNPSEGGVVNFQDASSGFKAALHLSRTGKLLFIDNSGAIIATGTTTLASGQVYAISAMIGTGSNAAWQILLNGNVEMSGTGNLGSNNNGSLKLGGNAAYTATFYYDDICINSQAFPGPVPTGTVQFLVDGSAYGSAVPLSDGMATSAPTSTLPAGSHTITASYSGDSTYASSSGSLPGGQTINGQSATSSTTVVSSANPSLFGQTVNFTATISAGGTGTPTGSVTFFDGSTSIGQGTLSTSGGISTASLSTSSLGVGIHTITASYSGDSTFSGSSGNLTQTVAQASTSTAVTASANPSSAGQSVTFTATISASGAGTAPTGTVQWLVDNTKQGSPVPVSLSGGVVTATLSLSSLGGGTHAITASYSGDGNYLASSGTLQQTVNGAATTSSSTTVASSANPQTAGQPVSWTATVTAATGSVNFVNFETGDFTQAASHVGGAVVTSPALAGTYSLQLQRNGSVANYEIRQSGTTYYNLPTAYYRFLFEFTSNPGEGGVVNFQDTASGFKAALHLSASGKLLFIDSTGAVLATGTTTLVAGQVYAISAMIGTGSSNAAWQILLNGNVEMSGTGNLGSNNNGSLKLGGNAAYTAIFYYDDICINSQAFPGPVPTGTVQFLVDGSAYLGAVPLSDGMATSAPTSTLPAGSHTITASYSGDGTYASSSGSLPGGQTISSPSTGIPSGTILVVSSPLAGQTSAPSGIIGVNPSTGAQFVVSSGGQFSLPETIREGPNQQLYVADYLATGNGAVIGVDPNTGQQTIVAKGGNINGPDALAIVNGILYVADAGSSVPNLVAINLTTFQQSLISSGGSFATPVGLAPAPNGNIYWADETAFGGVGAIFLVNVQTGAQTVVSQGNLLNHMIDLGLDSSGNLIAINGGSGSGGSVVRINPQNGTQTTVSSGGILTGLDGGTVDPAHGTIYLAALASGNLASRILAVNPTTGAQSTIASGGNLSLVAGMVIFTQSGAGAAALPSGGASLPAQIVTPSAAAQPAADPSQGGAVSTPLLVTPPPVSASPLAPAVTGASPASVMASPQTQAALLASTSGLAATGTGSLQDTATSSDGVQPALARDAVDSVFAAWNGGLSQYSVG